MQMPEDTKPHDAMTPMSRPTLYRNQSMQKYMLLSAQKEALQRRMAMEIPSNAPMTPSSPEFQSLSSSPTSSKYSSPYPTMSDSIPTSSRTSVTPRTSIDDMHTEESHKLAEINQQIVATLTELLNTECIRNDEKQRVWIQERLMEAEHQIRRERRRHSSNVGGDFATAIAQHLELGLNHSKTWA